MTNLPLVSVVVPTRDRPAMLRRALRRIETQTYQGPIETIVVFDRSELDLTLERSDPHRRVRGITNTRTPGLAGGRNSGAQAAEGEYLAFCDDDDEWLPGKLAAQIDLLRASPDAAVATCGIYIQYKGKVTTRVPDEDLLDFDGFLRDRMTEVHPSSFVVETVAFREKIGLVDEELPGSYAEDYEWLLRASRATTIVSVPEPLARIWWHPKSFFSDRWRMIDDALEHLLETYPEFRDCPEGWARIRGQQAFARAAVGDRDRAISAIRETLRADRGEKRALLAGLVVAGVPADRLLALAHRFGRGI